MLSKELKRMRSELCKILNTNDEPSPSKYQILDEIYESNPNITNAKLRQKSHIGSRLVNEFLKTKRQ